MSGFPVAYRDIIDRIDAIDPEAYARTRNHLSGAVTRLSPFISRGVISPRRVLEIIVGRGFTKYSCEKLIQELAWREYFQRVWQERPGLADTYIRNPQMNVRMQGIPKALAEASTGIMAIDKGIGELFDTGYMHNHLRMYVASIACNVARCSWTDAGRWMYYHLLDADPASNFCSWQWICGAFSSKRYFANQENINRNCGTEQRGTFLDRSFEEPADMEVPDVLLETVMPHLHTPLPKTTFPGTDPEKPLLVYDFFNLDPQWHRQTDCSRVLLLAPSLFQKFPVSNKVVDFMLALAGEIEGLQVFTGEFDELEKGALYSQIIYREHPSCLHYRGQREEREWIFPEVKGYFPSFSAYWKKCIPYLKDYFA